jgi:hypothetical protein
MKSDQASKSIKWILYIYIYIYTHTHTHIPPSKVKGKPISVTGDEGPHGCEVLRLAHFLDNWLTDGGEIVNVTRQLALL